MSSEKTAINLKINKYISPTMNMHFEKGRVVRYLKTYEDPF